MFQGLTVPIAAKICAAVLVVGGAGAATYEVVGTDGDSAATVVSDSPDTLAYADGAAKVKRTPDALDVEEPTLPQWATDRKVPLEAEEETEKAAAEEAAEKAAAEEEAKKAAEEEAEKAAAEEEAKKKAAEEEAEKAAAEEEAKKKAEEEADNETWIEILWPEPESHYDDKVVVFEGKSEPGSKVFAGRYLANSDDDGNWRIELILSPGANKAVLKAEDAAGNLADDSITVWLDVEEEKHEDPKEKDPKHEEPKEDPKEEDPKEAVEVEFSAKQQYGECDAEVPYDVFWGTATPNSTVQISSDFGSATVEVNKDGHWEKKVWFEQAPRGTEFPVMVTADNGSKRFSFYAVPFEVEVPKEDPVEKLDGVDVEGHEGHEDPK